MAHPLTIQIPTPVFECLQERAKQLGKTPEVVAAECVAHSIGPVNSEPLHAEMEKARLDSICKDFKPEFTMQEIYSQVDREATVDQIIAELETGTGKKA